MGEITNTPGRSTRFRTVGVFALAVILTAGVAVGLQYYFSRAAAIESSLRQYQQTAHATSEYLGFVDSKTAEMTRILSRYPALVSAGTILAAAPGIFAEIMESNPLLYAIYIGMEDGTFYELVNLETSVAVRRQLQATHEDRWVEITMEGSGKQRVRRLTYLDETMSERISRSEPSEYHPATRNWFKQAQKTSVVKTGPYQFQHLQAPGQSYSIKIPGSHAVLAFDIALSSLSHYLAEQVQTHKGEVFVFQRSGEIVASNQLPSTVNTLEIPPVTLNEKEKNYIKNKGAVLVSNELDWAPVDYAVAGAPRGYAVDLLKLIRQGTNLDIEFVNGHSWAELVKLFRKGDLDVLQPVFHDAQHEELGLFSDTILQIPYAVVTQPGVPPISSLADLHGQTVAIPSGWTILQILREHYPQIHILESASSRGAIAAVQKGEAYATIDSSIALHYTADQFFMNDIKFHEGVAFSGTALPDELQFLVRKDQPELVSILNKALANVSTTQKQILYDKWFSGVEQTNQSQQPAVVPYREVLDAAANDLQMDQLVEVGLNGDSYFMYITRLGKVNLRGEYFALVIPRHKILADSVQKAQLTVLAIAISLLLVPILVFSIFSTINRGNKRI